MPKVRGLHLPARPEKVGNAPRNPNCNIIYLKTGLLILYQKCIRYIIVANDILTHFRKNRARYDVVKICYGENIRNIHSYEQFGVSSEMEKKIARNRYLRAILQSTRLQNRTQKFLQHLCTYNAVVLLSSCLLAWLALHPAFASQDFVESTEMLQFLPW